MFFTAHVRIGRASVLTIWFALPLVLLFATAARVCLLQPVVPRPDESVSQLHSRYTAALLELGKQHNVQLNIVD